jgi:hypothetical protein
MGVGIEYSHDGSHNFTSIYERTTFLAVVRDIFILHESS